MTRFTFIYNVIDEINATQLWSPTRKEGNEIEMQDQEQLTLSCSTSPDITMSHEPSFTDKKSETGDYNNRTNSNSETHTSAVESETDEYEFDDENLDTIT